VFRRLSMFRRLSITFAVAAVLPFAATFAFVDPNGVAGATAGTIQLLIPANVAYSLLGHACTPVQETITAEGFDSSTAFPVANALVATTCSGSGRGGGGHHTYTAATGAIWDDSGDLVALEPTYSNPNAGPGFTAFDSYGNEEYQSGSSTYLQWATGFVPIPRVTGLSVTAGSMAGGQAETVSGSGFTNATAVDFGSIAVPFTVVNDNTISVTTPPDNVTSDTTVDLTVASSQGTSTTTSSDQFTYTLPEVTSLSVSDGPAAGGTSVTISGVGFHGAVAVDFGTAEASSFSVVDDNTINAVTPSTSSGTVDVTVSSVDGAGAPSPADQFTFVAAPVITQLSPTKGPWTGGTAVTITGQNFTGATSVTFGEDPAAFTVDSDTQITASTPNVGGPDTGNVIVTTVGGTNAPTPADVFTFTKTDYLAVSPSSGAPGSQVVISGAGFAAGETVKVKYKTALATPRDVLLCVATADSDGTVTCPATIPTTDSGAAGAHALKAKGTTSGVTYVTTFSLT
jgi:large repetitive protein